MEIIIKENLRGIAHEHYEKIYKNTLMNDNMPTSLLLLLMKDHETLSVYEETRFYLAGLVQLIDNESLRELAECKSGTVVTVYLDDKKDTVMYNGQITNTLENVNWHQTLFTREVLLQDISRHKKRD